ncbi:MAG: hypothetical protein NT090_12635 [Acidobacteria bacterium]|nr:hypothetical protein [Acidobacteriota bacterium]
MLPPWATKPEMILTYVLFLLAAVISIYSKSQLVEKIGTLPARRVGEILDGIALVLQPRDIH